MALARLKNWIAETLTFSDLNAEFNNILNNVSSLITPITFNLTFTDNTYDIGASGATRPRDMYLARNMVIGGNTTLGDASGDSVTQNALTTNFVNGWNGQANGSNALVLSTAGELTKPLQPAFLAVNSVTDTNATGDGTTYTIICDTEIYDQNADYNNATGIFTAPVTGRYHFASTIRMDALGVGHTSLQMQLVTSNRNIILAEFNPYAASAAALAMASGSSYVDMDAADTASITITVSGSTKTVSVVLTNTTFSGSLVC